jgi:hypothetical protein
LQHVIDVPIRQIRHQLPIGRADYPILLSLLG